MITYIDCGSGVAGDMILGALIGLGVSPVELEATLKKAIPLKGWSLRIRSIERRMWPAWSLRVIKDRPYTSPRSMMALIQDAPLPNPVRQRSSHILQTLCKAEIGAHGHDHGRFDPKGLGRIDTMVDVIGSSWGFWRLGISSVIASPLNTGRISPATARILKQKKVPIYSDSPKHELATPTGAAILSSVTSRFSPLKPITLLKAGYGAGTLERKGQPNVLAIYQGKPTQKLVK